jgi:AcrR family transcriptional regulator
MIRSFMASSAPDRSGASPARRARILEAALGRFSRSGLRGVTMESVAADAGVAKATLYAYFRDRDALFSAVAAWLADSLAADALAALEGEGRSLDDRIAAALAGKHRRVWELVRGSPHARELLGEKDRLAAASVAAADARIVAALEAALAADAPLADVAPAAARALFFGADGIAAQATDALRLAQELDDFVRTYLRGLRARARSGPT